MNNQNPQKMNKSLRGLELQQKRVHDAQHAVHDADFYIILLRRLYREIEETAKKDSRVANLKGKYKDLLDKIKLRDHFEHDPDNISLATPEQLRKLNISDTLNVKIKTSTIQKKDSVDIVSGNYVWNTKDDHEAFIKMINEFVKLYPYEDKPIREKVSYKQLEDKIIELETKIAELEQEQRSISDAEK